MPCGALPRELEGSREACFPIEIQPRRQGEAGGEIEAWEQDKEGGNACDEGEEERLEQAEDKLEYNPPERLCFGLPFIEEPKDLLPQQKTKAEAQERAPEAKSKGKPKLMDRQGRICLRRRSSDDDARLSIGVDR